MKLGIDASNLRAGGGVTHLVELLRIADPLKHGFDQVVVWGGEKILKQVEERPWLVKNHQILLDKALPFRVFWQRFTLTRLARAFCCDVLFVPGGLYTGDFCPFVTMSRNFLPFNWRELRRYGLSWMLLRCVLLRYKQSRTFRRSDGLIFLTRYAKDAVMRVIKTTKGKTTIIPHGVNGRFRRPSREQLSVTEYKKNRSFRILYVSIIDVYKHQWYVAEAVAQLRRCGLPVVLNLVGPAYPPALKRLQKTVARIDPDGEYIRYVGEIPHAELHKQYAQSNLCLFASSCENMPNILLEIMASSLPIACSNHKPMPELLGDAGVYFDPENPAEIASAIRTMIESPELCAKMAQMSFERAQEYSWALCSDRTFEFLAEVACTFQKDRVI